MISYNWSCTQYLTVKSQTLSLSMKITNTHQQIMQIYKWYTGNWKQKVDQESKVNVFICELYVYGWKALWPTSCRSKSQIDVWWRQQSILDPLRVKMFLRVINTFFSLTLGPHHQRVLVFSSGNVLSVFNFFLASCAFCFHWYHLFLAITMS